MLKSHSSALLIPTVFRKPWIHKALRASTTVTSYSPPVVGTTSLISFPPTMTPPPPRHSYASTASQISGKSYMHLGAHLSVLMYTTGTAGGIR